MLRILGWKSLEEMDWQFDGILAIGDMPLRILWHKKLVAAVALIGRGLFVSNLPKSLIAMIKHRDSLAAFRIFFDQA
jgi:hypothetical protein